MTYYCRPFRSHQVISGEVIIHPGNIVKVPGAPNVCRNSFVKVIAYVMDVFFSKFYICVSSINGVNNKLTISSFIELKFKMH